MKTPVQPVPSEYTAVTPYLMVHDVPALLRFLEQVFGAVETERHDTPDGTIMHAEARIRGAAIMMGTARGSWPPIPGSLYIYVPDVDATYAKALAAGATSIMEPTDMFYGDRHGGVKDACGNSWWIATHIEDVSPDERLRRAREFAAKQNDCA
jgi:PhnB protein